MKRIYNKQFLLSLVLSGVIDGLLLLSFKNFRSFFPPPEIGQEKLVGFAQYYGYPIYYDTIYFFILLIVPIITFFIVYTRGKK